MNITETLSYLFTAFSLQRIHEGSRQREPLSLLANQYLMDISLKSFVYFRYST
jgi:hypothetical protein